MFGKIHEAIIKSSSSLGMLGMLKLDAFLKDNLVLTL